MSEDSSDITDPETVCGVTKNLCDLVGVGSLRGPDLHEAVTQEGDDDPCVRIRSRRLRDWHDQGVYDQWPGWCAACLPIPATEVLRRLFREAWVTRTGISPVTMAAWRWLP